MSEEEAFGTLIRKLNPHIGTEGSMYFTRMGTEVQGAETTPADVSKMEVEVDNSPIEWGFREEPHSIIKALRIRYRYPSLNAQREVLYWVSEHLLVGYEGSDTSGRPRAARIGRTRSGDLQLIRSLSNTIAENVGQSARSDYEAATTLRNLTYERLSTADASGKHAAALSSSIGLEIGLLIFIVLNFSQGMRAFSELTNLVIDTAFGETVATVVIPQWTSVGLLWFGALGVFLVLVDEI
jgi:hypothetical protein